MIPALQAVLMLGLLVSSLLLFLAVRQMGVLGRRVVGKPTSGPALTAGMAAPRLEFAAYGKEEVIRLPIAGEGKSYLLFISFSCPMCRGLMADLPKLPAELARRLVLLFLDENPSDRYSRDLEKLQRLACPMAHGYEIASEFRISTAPYLYAVDSDGVIRDNRIVYTLDALKVAMDREASVATEA
jgi:hypothetical protein